MHLEDGRTLPANVRIESSTGSGTWLRFVLREGRNRQIRRMVEAMNHQVHRILRTRVGTVTLGDLAPGEWRELTSDEVAALRDPDHAVTEEPSGAKTGAEPRYKPGWARPKPRPTRPGQRSRQRRGSRTTRGRGGRRRKG
jgi:23S rRNA pseudouridine2605 synthase